MRDHQEPPRPDTTDHGSAATAPRPSRRWLYMVVAGVGTQLVGAALEWSPFRLACCSDVLGPRLEFLGLPLAYVGLAGMAHTAGRSCFWSYWALLPVVGPLIAMGLLTRTRPMTEPRPTPGPWHWIRVGVVMIVIPWSVWKGMDAYVTKDSRPSYGSEVKVNLHGLWVAEAAFYSENGRYGTFDEIGFMPGPRLRYTYRIDGSGKAGTVIPASTGHPTPDNTVVPAALGATGFTATATANLDNDATIDQWHVNDQDASPRTDVNDEEH